MKQNAIILWFSIALFCSCENASVRSTLNELESSMDMAPELALTRLESINQENLNSMKLKADWSLLRVMALDKSFVDTSDVELIMPAVKYYNLHHQLLRQAQIYYYLGRLQYNGGKFADAAVSFTRSLEYSSRRNDFRFRAMALQSLADTYGAASLFEEAIRFSDSAYVCCIKAGDSNMADEAIARRMNYESMYDPSTANLSAASALRDYFALTLGQAKNRLKLSRIVIILVLLLALALVSLAYLAYKRRTDAEKRDKEARLQEIHHSLYRNSFKQMGRILETYALSKTTQNPERFFYRECRKLLDDLKLDNANRERFEQRINDDLGGVIAFFRAEFPKLSEQDYQVASYIFAGFDASTIVLLAGITSQGAFYTKKSRLKKLIQKSDAPHRELFLKSIN